MCASMNEIDNPAALKPDAVEPLLAAVLTFDRKEYHESEGVPVEKSVPPRGSVYSVAHSRRCTWRATLPEEANARGTPGQNGSNA